MVFVMTPSCLRREVGGRDLFAGKFSVNAVARGGAPHSANDGRDISPKKFHCVPALCSDETKAKISQARMGMKFSEETREKMRQAKLGKQHSIREPTAPLPPAPMKQGLVGSCGLRENIQAHRSNSVC
jgi:hypothetical protein